MGWLFEKRNKLQKFDLIMGVLQISCQNQRSKHFNLKYIYLICYKNAKKVGPNDPAVLKQFHWQRDSCWQATKNQWGGISFARWITGTFTKFGNY